MDTISAAERLGQMAVAFQFENKKLSFATILSFHLNFSKWEIPFSITGQAKFYKLHLNKQ